MSDGRGLESEGYEERERERGGGDGLGGVGEGRESHCEKWRMGEGIAM